MYHTFLAVVFDAGASTSALGSTGRKT
jgi:hypothetical protein